jgi:hypothetical protein
MAEDQVDRLIEKRGHGVTALDSGKELLSAQDACQALAGFFFGRFFGTLLWFRSETPAVLRRGSENGTQPQSGSDFEVVFRDVSLGDSSRIPKSLQSPPERKSNESVYRQFVF